MSTPTPSSRRRLLAAGVGLGLAAAAAFGVLGLAWRSNAPPARPPPGEVVFDASVSLDLVAVDRRLLAPGPSVFDIEVTTSVPVTVTFGPPAPSTVDAEGGPAPETATSLSGWVNGALTGSVRVYAAGIQVLRLVPAHAAPASSKARILVRRRSGS
jgi:hypothetical protein